MGQGSTTSVDFSVPGGTRIVERTRQLVHGLFSSYHPELHYMRGPGPKWREKHGQPAAGRHLEEHGVSDLWKAGA